MSLLTTSELCFAAAGDAFLAGAGLAPSSARSYRQILAALERELGASTSLSAIGAEHYEHAALDAWGELAPASWNRNTAALKAFLRWVGSDEVAATLTRRLRRRREHHDETRSIAYAQLERLWTRPEIPLREKTLWRLLYETAGRASEILALNIEHVDLANHRARIRSKGGDVELVYYQSASARLLPRLLAGRRYGPVFITEQAARAGTARLDVCPVTGNARLSYRRAAALFSEYSNGWTLHQLRHSAITHLAEAGESTVLLMAKSRHRSLRTLELYARPGHEAVAALTARNDPSRRI